MDTIELESPDHLCPNCQAIIVAGHSFCGQCGKALIKADEQKPGNDVFDDLQPTLAYYLLPLCCWQFTSLAIFFLQGSREI
jgi:ribosomal protein S27AE